jgi:hypothetical protein
MDVLGGWLRQKDQPFSTRWLPDKAAATPEERRDYSGGARRRGATQYPEGHNASRWATG